MKNECYLLHLLECDPEPAIYVLEPASVRYQKEYDDACAGTVLPGEHIEGYLQGYTAGAVECHQPGSLTINDNNINQIALGLAQSGSNNNRSGL